MLCSMGTTRVKDEVRWLIKHLQNEIKLLSEDTTISKRYD